MIQLDKFASRKYKPKKGPIIQPFCPDFTLGKFRFWMIWHDLAIPYKIGPDLARLGDPSRFDKILLYLTRLDQIGIYLARLGQICQIVPYCATLGQIGPYWSIAGHLMEFVLTHIILAPGMCGRWGPGRAGCHHFNFIQRIRHCVLN